MTLETEWVEIDKLVPWDQNPRVNDGAVDAIAKSIERFGFASPIIARRADSVVIAGHTRLKASQRLGLDKVLVRFMDLDPAMARALALADNKLGELADWSGGLGSVLRDLEGEGLDLDGLGWDADELDGLLDVPPDALGEGDPDSAPSLSDEPPNSELGCVYELGPHRLICGDATKSEVWQDLMGGAVADCLWTDPPYGVSYVGKTEEALTIQNDDLDEDELSEFLNATFKNVYASMKPGGVWDVASPAGPLFFVFAEHLRAMKVWRHTLVWAKDRFVLGRCDYHYRHEAIFYGWSPGAAHYFCDDRTKDTLIQCPRPSASRDHPTMKPVDLVKRMIENSTKKGWLVVDPFGGSGSTLIAAAASGRVARLIELSPAYCDVIRKRWTRFAKENNADPGSGALEEITDGSSN